MIDTIYDAIESEEKKKWKRLASFVTWPKHK